LLGAVAGGGGAVSAVVMLILSGLVGKGAENLAAVFSLLVGSAAGFVLLYYLKKK